MNLVDIIVVGTPRTPSGISILGNGEKVSQIWVMAMPRDLWTLIRAHRSQRRIDLDMGVRVNDMPYSLQHCLHAVQPYPHSVVNLKMPVDVVPSIRHRIMEDGTTETSTRMLLVVQDQLAMHSIDGDNRLLCAIYS